jgi:hypothetical protein
LREITGRRGGLLENLWENTTTLVSDQAGGDRALISTLGEELLKPIAEGGSAYGIAELLGIKDPRDRNGQSF